MMKSKKFLVFASIGLVVPMLMGAKLTMKVTPNPGGAANILEGEGTWELANGEKFVKLTFETALKDSAFGQYSIVDGTLAGAKWSATLKLPPKTHNPTKATLHFTDSVGKPRSVSVLVKTDQDVK